MKFTVLVVALLLHQVMCDRNTQVVTRASNSFANRLYQKVSQPKGNVLVCPLSLHVALALVHQGADGNTERQMGTALGLGNANADVVRQSYKAVLSGMKDNTIKIATKLFPAKDYQLNEDYVKTAQNYFLSDVENLDYRNAQASANTINKYVEDKTNNKIHNLISSDAITPSTKLIIINAVHFQASWKKTFATAYLDDFRASKSEPPIKTRMMSQTDTFAYKEDPDLQAKILKMDYAEGGYSMLFILPNKEDGLKAVEDKLATKNLEDILKNMQDTRVEVTIPKFKLEMTLNLKETLIEMGMQDIFSPRADLHKVASGEERLYVSDVIQKTFINVHENGTEAAAATVLLETLSANFDEKTFFAKRPFHFYLIRSKVPKMVLFEGRYVRPEYAESDSEESDIPEEENVNTIGNNGGETENPNRIDFEGQQNGNQGSKINGQSHQTGSHRPNGGFPPQNSPNNQLNNEQVIFPTSRPSENNNNFKGPQNGNNNSPSTGLTYQTGSQRPNVNLPSDNSPNGNQDQFDADRSSFSNPTANPPFDNNRPQYPSQPQQQPYGTQQQPGPTQQQSYVPQPHMTYEQYQAYLQQAIQQQLAHQAELHRRQQTQRPAFG